MMKKSFFRHFALAACLCLFATSCDNKFGDDLRSLGHRVEILEERVLEMNTSIEALQAIITTIQTNGYITDIQHNSDGSITLTFNNGNIVTLHDGRIGQDGNDGRDGQDGQDGQEAELIVGVWQDIDGMWYWTVNGTWLLDADGNKVRAGAVDGKDGLDGQDGHDGQDGRDGKDGKDGKDGIVPQVRINADGIWEISSDGGETWVSTGVPANGKDGEPGRADIFASVTLSADGKYLIVQLADGSDPFYIPVM
jgi:hypothetical protein